jgi:thiamine-phosphate pyrophosphorylase
MVARQPLPRLWLMTDERMGDRLPRALHRLPRGAGIVFRHYATFSADRRALFAEIRRIARRRGLILLLAGTAREATRWGADGVHNAVGRAPARMIRTAAAHDRRQIVRAVRDRADLVFLSPVFPTRSHPGEPALGRYRFRAIAQASPVPIVALGGMDARRARTIRAYGWAGIDAWVR